MIIMIIKAELIVFFPLHWPVWSTIVESVHFGRCPGAQREKTKLIAKWSVGRQCKLFP